MKPKAPTDDYLRPLTKPVNHKPYLTIDIESKDGPSDRAGFTRPFLIGLYDGLDFRTFSGTSRGQDWQEAIIREGNCVDLTMRAVLSPEYSGHHIYAHNAGRFDFLFLLPWLATVGAAEGFRFEIVPTHSAIQLIDVWKGTQKRQRWRFLDSYRLLPSGLDKLAKAFGFGGKVSHDLNLPEHDHRWIEYLEGDCVKLYGVLGRFHELVLSLGGEVGITAPSTAMKTFRRKYLLEAIPRIRSSHDFIRSSYVGGRAELFAKEGEGLRYYDRNSSYPAAMLEPMPCGKATFWKGKPHGDLIQAGQVGFCDCDVIIPEGGELPPPLPVRHEGKLLFPVGKLSGIWDYKELELLEQVGGEVVNWRASCWYETKPIFRQMILDLYPFRDRSRPDYDEAIAQVVKILLNSLYGKFGSKPKRRRIFLADGEEPIPDGATPAIPGDPDSFVWYLEEECDQAYIMPQISAHVTSLARLALWDVMADIVRRGHQVYYCDTDSVMTTATMHSSTELGGWKDEYPGYTFRGRFIAPKVYLLEAEQAGGPAVIGRAKGIRRAQRDDILRFAAGETLVFDELEKLGALCRGNLQKTPVMRQVSKTFRDRSSKREFLPDGSSKPLVFSQW